MNLDDSDGLEGRRLIFASLATFAALMMALLDSSIVNVALPSIAKDLSVSDGKSVWVVNAYQLAVIIALLPLASLGEIVGFRRIHTIGLILFTVASICCALSPTLTSLTMSRAAQGLGAAAMISVNIALIRALFPREKIGRGIGVMAMVGSIATAVGPTVASAILSVGHWPWLFAVNAPVGAVALLLTRLYIPPSIPTKRPFDVMSAVLSALTFGLFVAALDAFAHGGGDRAVLSMVVVALIACIWLTRRQLRMPDPLLPVDLLKIPIFALSIASALCCFIAQGLAFVAIPFQLHNVVGLNQVATGLFITPWPIAVVLISPIAAKLSGRYPAALIGGIGLFIMAGGLLLMTTLRSDSWHVAIALWTSVCGLGFGLFNAPNNRAIVTAAPAQRSGAASGMLATARLLGQTLGAALVALCFELMSHGWNMALYLGAAFSVCAGVASVGRRYASPAR
jgi:DHA2 family multidrug resistance protein-like MFS transporter